MANLNRRRSIPSGSSAEIEQLKQELAELRAAYSRDMMHISADMQALSTKIEVPAQIEAPAEPEPET